MVRDIVRGMIEIQLEQLLNERGMTAYALAKQAGLHQSVIAKFRHNEVKAVRLDVLEKICAALECEPGDLLIRKAEKKNKTSGNG